MLGFFLPVSLIVERPLSQVTDFRFGSLAVSQTSGKRPLSKMLAYGPR